MRHRHLDDPGFTLAAIDDIVSRGGLEDWIALGLAVEREPTIRDRLAYVLASRTGDESSINHDFWRTRLALRPHGRLAETVPP